MRGLLASLVLAIIALSSLPSTLGLPAAADDVAAALEKRSTGQHTFGLQNKRLNSFDSPSRRLRARSLGYAPQQAQKRFDARLEKRAAAGDEDSARLAAVKQTFMENYSNYSQYAFPDDYLSPLAKKGQNDDILAGWGGTAVDALSTFIVLGLDDTQEFKQALDHVKTIDFTKTDQGDSPGDASVFELTIRYLGSLVSVYELLGEKPEHRFLIDKADVLASRLSHAWVNGSSMPFNRFNINNLVPTEPDKNTTSMATAGTLTLEWAALARHTNNATYAKLVNDSVSALIGSDVVLPGLYGQGIGIFNKTHTDKYITIGGGTDSFYEYLIKYPLLVGKEGTPEEAAYARFADNALKSLVVDVSAGSDHFTFLSDYDGDEGKPVYVFSHLACFVGGSLALGGATLGKDDWVQRGLEMAESCARVGLKTATGIVPEAWGYYDKSGQAKGWDFVSAGRAEVAAQKGFFLTSPGYLQRPEVAESLFYGWRISRNPLFRDLAWELFVHMRKYLATNNGWIGLVNVEDLSSVVYDQQQSFLYGETFKYLGLIFEDSSKWSLDEYVFNTEAHPLKAAPRPSGFAPVQSRNFPYKPLSSSMTFGKPGSPGPVVSAGRRDEGSQRPSDEGSQRSSSDGSAKTTTAGNEGMALVSSGRDAAVDAMCRQIPSMPRHVAERMFSSVPREKPPTLSIGLLGSINVNLDLDLDLGLGIHL